MTTKTTKGRDVTIGLTQFAVRYRAHEDGRECRLYLRHPNGDVDLAEYGAGVGESDTEALAAAVECATARLRETQD